MATDGPGTNQDGAVTDKTGGDAEVNPRETDHPTGSQQAAENAADESPS